MSALTLFGNTPSILARPQLGFPGSLFESMERNLRALRPELNFAPVAELKRSGDDLEVALELPGIDPKEDVQLRLQGNRLVVSGERKREKSENGYTEFSYGIFSRSIELPSGITEEHIAASYDAGVLRVNIQGALGDEQGARNIPIAVSSKGEQEKLEMREKEGGGAAESVAADSGTAATES